MARQHVIPYIYDNVTFCWYFGVNVLLSSWLNDTKRAYDSAYLKARKYLAPFNTVPFS